jgi:hypothetical protein
MSKSKKDLLSEIVSMTLAMESIMAEAKVKEGHLSTHIESDSLPLEMIREAHKWLKGIFENQFAAIQTVKRLLPGELWARYKAWGGFENHQEVKLLREKMIPFRSELVSRNRPNLFKKGIVNALIKESAKNT